MSNLSQFVAISPSLSHGIWSLSFSTFACIFFIHKQVWYSNPSLRDWLKEHAHKSQLNKLMWKYYQVNKSPWYVSCQAPSYTILLFILFDSLHIHLYRKSYSIYF